MTCSRNTARMAARADSGASRPMSGSTLSARVTGRPPSRRTAATSSRTAALPASTTGTDRSAPASGGRVVPEHRGLAAVGPADQQDDVGRHLGQHRERVVVQPAGGDVHDPRPGGERGPMAGLGADQLLVADDGEPQPAPGAGAGGDRDVGEARRRLQDAGDDVVERRRRLGGVQQRPGADVDERRLRVRRADVDARDPVRTHPADPIRAARAAVQPRASRRRGAPRLRACRRCTERPPCRGTGSCVSGGRPSPLRCR